MKKRKIGQLLALVFISGQLLAPVSTLAETKDKNEIQEEKQAVNLQEEQPESGTTQKQANSLFEERTIDSKEQSTIYNQENSQLTRQAGEGITVTPNYTDGANFKDVSLLTYTISIKNGFVAKGEKLTFQLSDPSIVSQFVSNGGDAYGDWWIDLANGKVVYTFKTDVDPSATLNFILNVTTKNLTTTNGMTVSLGDTVLINSSFTTTFKNQSGGGSYNGQMTFPDRGKYISGVQVPDSIIDNFISQNYFLPNTPTMDVSFVYDAGFYNHSKNDWVNRKVRVMAPGENAGIDASHIYFSNKIGFPNLSTSFVPIESKGISAEQIDEQTVELTFPDNQDFSWGDFLLRVKSTCVDS